MGEVEEQKFACKFCNKICISGKSLGGHMRCHLALIAADRKSKRKADNSNTTTTTIDFELEDVNGNDDHGDSGLEEKNLNVSVNFLQSQSIKNWADDEGENSTMNLEMEDQDQDQNQDSHVLRQNPKKSWKNSDLRIKPCQTKSNSCRECGKKFSSPRALAGHMRTHSTLSSTKSKDKHECSKCDRSFESRNSLYGHMKTHSNKSRVSVESDSCLSDFEFYHPKKKRSITRYRTSQTFPFSSENEPSTVNEIDELDVEAAISLIMLSRGLRDHDVFNFKKETFCDFDENGIPILTLNSCLLVSLNSEPNHNSPEFFYSIDKKTDQDEQKCIDTTDFETLDGSDTKREYKCKICKMIFKSHQALGGHSNRHKMMITSSSPDDAMIYVLSDNPHNEMIQNKEHECQICFKIFPTGKALGGHKRAHYNRQIDNQDLQDIQPILDLNLPVITHMDTTRAEDIESSLRLTEFVPSVTANGTS